KRRVIADHYVAEAAADVGTGAHSYAGVVAADGVVNESTLTKRIVAAAGRIVGERIDAKRIVGAAGGVELERAKAKRVIERTGRVALHRLRAKRVVVGARVPLRRIALQSIVAHGKVAGRRGTGGICHRILP